ncbi:hypothetical protein C8J57DRAFT_1524224 [Mycena rebaudengoi]|nr:hypothetical protein C8J57DRAFT_1524224 [Mycena rebaudengoi]
MPLKDSKINSFFKKAARALSPVSSAPLPVHPSVQSAAPDGVPRPVSDFFDDISVPPGTGAILSLTSVPPSSPHSFIGTSPIDPSRHSHSVDNAAGDSCSHPAKDVPLQRRESPERFGECSGLRLTFPAGQDQLIVYPFGLYES